MARTGAPRDLEGARPEFPLPQQTKGRGRESSCPRQLGFEPRWLEPKWPYEYVQNILMV